jgi:branched-chain amino acid transport system substrate-binding protein
MLRRRFLGLFGVVGLVLGGAPAVAQEPFKLGLILPMTGPFASTGRQIEAAARLYMQQNGDTVAGKKIQFIVKDDTGVADVTKRLAQDGATQTSP